MKTYALKSECKGNIMSSSFSSDQICKHEICKHTKFYKPYGAFITHIDELDNVKDEHFYVKLQKLIKLNKQTLAECDRLFKEKTIKNDVLLSSQSKQINENTFSKRLAEMAEDEYYGEHLTSSDFFATTNEYDAKPRLIFDIQKDKYDFLSKDDLLRNSDITMFPHNDEITKVSGSDQNTRRAHSLDEQLWKNVLVESPIDNHLKNDGVMDKTLLQAVASISNMWNDFEDKKYSNEIVVSKPLAELNKKIIHKQDLAKKWRHRITIPIPFQMSLREESRVKSKSRTQREMEEQRIERQHREEIECKRKFKAKPVPAHIYLPLYQEILEKSESHHKSKIFNKEITKFQQNPFCFKKEEDKIVSRIYSVRDEDNITCSVPSMGNKLFVAKPVPKFVLKSSCDKQLEEEECRKIRIRMRAHDLLRKSSLPPNMAAMQKNKREVKKIRIAKLQNARKKKKNINKDFEYTVLQRFCQKHPRCTGILEEPITAKKSFIETDCLKAENGTVTPATNKEESQQQASKFNFGIISSTLDSIPIKSSASNDLRTAYHRSMAEREKRMTEHKDEARQRKCMRESRLRRYIVHHTEGNPVKDIQLMERVKQHKIADSSNSEEYAHNLKEMKERVDKRPLLFECEMQKNACKSAERRYKGILKDVGVNDEFVGRHSSAAASTHTDSRAVGCHGNGFDMEIGETHKEHVESC